MAFSELQIALIGAGAAAVALVWGYNLWQDRKHRKTAEKIFKGGEGDALLAGNAVPAPATVLRREPQFRGRRKRAGVRGPRRGTGCPGRRGQPGRPNLMPRPGMPPECADEIADCVLRFTAAEPIPAPAVQAMQTAWAGDSRKPCTGWQKAMAMSAWRLHRRRRLGRYRNWAVALQLVDRRGPVSDGELARFFDGVQRWRSRRERPSNCHRAANW
jgi:hypothetical protein